MIERWREKQREWKIAKQTNKKMACTSQNFDSEGGGHGNDGGENALLKHKVDRTPQHRPQRKHQVIFVKIPPKPPSLQMERQPITDHQARKVPMPPED